MDDLTGRRISGMVIEEQGDARGFRPHSMSDWSRTPRESRQDQQQQCKIA